MTGLFATQFARLIATATFAVDAPKAAALAAPAAK
jgi:hypothetical protein